MSAESQHQYTNRLIHEKSPYLLQHAHNPVDWYAWGPEAFHAAQEVDKPIFLSIGYATCHWCHVMERESFENPQIAKLMNETFINIKVDREELPEVDAIYMEFAQALMSSAGGWPLNLILTPQLKPFFAVTYLPPHTQQGLIGLDEFVKQIGAIWQSDMRTQVVAQADKIVELFEKATIKISDDLPTKHHLDIGAQTLFELADPVYGGMKGEPKFPLAYQGNFLLEYSKNKTENRAAFYVELTLENMARGGIYDQLGGGFSRYTIDEKWEIPHFEKMLYDNALLIETYTLAWQFFKKPLFKQIALETCDYLLREMQSPEGGFYGAQDADFQGHEGSYYLWSLDEIQNALSPQEAELFVQVFSITHQGNFEGKNILHLSLPLQDLASRLGMTVEELHEKLTSIKQKLFGKRKERPSLFIDDKLLASWNGLMIHSLAKAALAFDEKKLLEAALKATQFIMSTLYKGGQLFHRYRDQEVRFLGGLDDYAFMIRALITLFEVTGTSVYLNEALQLADYLQQHFKQNQGAFYQAEKNEHLLLRKMEFYDGAEPSGNAVHAENLVRLYQMTQKESYLRQAEDIFRAAKGYLEAFPPGAAYHLLALQRYLDVQTPVVIVALNEKGEWREDIAKTVGTLFCPHLTLIWHAPSARAVDYLASKTAINNKTTVYICTQDRCLPPLSTKEEIISALKAL